MRSSTRSANLAGFAGPFATGHLMDLTGSYTAGRLCLSALGLMGMTIVLAIDHDRALENRLPLVHEREQSCERFALNVRAVVTRGARLRHLAREQRAVRQDLDASFNGVARPAGEDPRVTPDS